MNTIKITCFIGLLLIIVSCNSRSDTDTLFTRLPANKTGIDFENTLNASETFNVNEYGYFYNGGGVAIGDINNDGLPDVYFTGNMVSSHLYLNTGNLEFDNITKKAGVTAHGLWNTGVTMADVNNDGWLDIYVCRSAAALADRRKNLLFINNKDLTFTESAEQYGIADAGFSTNASFFDYDNDGDLDLFVLNHSTTKEFANFSRITSKLKEESNQNYEDRLYRNDNQRYIDVTKESGITTNVLGFGLGLAIADVNKDGWQDIYVSNDFNEQDYFYVNNGDGTFSERLDDFFEHVSLFSMGSDFSDINNDGYPDLMTLDMLPEENNRQKMVFGPDNYDKNKLLTKSGFGNQSMRNMLQLNTGGAYFKEIGQYSGVSNTDWSWGPLIADYDNDGLKDIFITNGYAKDFTNMDFMTFAMNEKLKNQKGKKSLSTLEIFDEMPTTLVANYMYQNTGQLKFKKRTKEWGFEEKTLSNGAAYGDLDGDGDLDLVINNINEKASIYENNSETLTTNHYIKIKLKGTKKNKFGLGVKVEIVAGLTKAYQEMMPTHGYQSSVNPELVFGLGKHKKINKVKVIWPDLREQVLFNLKSDTTVTLDQRNAVKPIYKKKTNPFGGGFQDVNIDTIINFKHVENNFIDFNREKLLPQMLSTQGPRIAKSDVNLDGLEDLYIGGAKGSSGKLFFQQKAGNFIASNNSIFEEDKNSEDIGVLFFDADNDGDKDLYVVSGGNDFEWDSSFLQDRLYINTGKGHFRKDSRALPKMLTSGSCVKAADFDNDGDEDLFVGGRVVPGRYPTAPRSYLLENDGKGRFKEITETVNSDISTIGMVTDAIWNDFNGDNTPDLILVGEWMGIRLFKNKDGALVEVTDTSGLKDTEGWWNVIKGTDFDNDGDTDFVIGNFGLNSQLKASASQPISLYSKDFDGNGSLDPIMCSYVQGIEYPVFSKDDLIDQLSYLKNKYLKYEDYANQKITDIFSQDELKNAQILTVKTLATSYLENKGDGMFELRALPQSTQFSSVYGILIDDFSFDGFPDILLGGNFYGNRVKFGKQDASNGVCIVNDHRGGFITIDNVDINLKVDGEIRDIEKFDSKDDGRLIVFCRNNEPLQMYILQRPASRLLKSQ